jgi:glucokinase
MGLDLGGTNIKFGLVAPDGTCSEFHSVPTPSGSGPQAITEQLAALISEAASKASSQNLEIHGVGIGVPALTDSFNGILLNAPNLKIQNYPIAKAVQDICSIPVWIDNDANAMLEGEAWLGSAQGLNHAILLTLGTGVGGAILSSGEVNRGYRGVAGEIGHMVIDINGSKCGCGNHGCFEQYASATALVRIAREILRFNGNKNKTSLVDNENLCARDIFSASTGGDSVARYATDQFSEYLGIGIANLVNIFNPEAVILSGGVVNAGAPLFDSVRTVVDKHTFKEDACAVSIIPATFGDKGGVLGAARIAYRRLEDQGQ